MGRPGADVLVPILWAEGALLLLGVVVLIGHAVWVQAHRSIVPHRRRLAQAELVSLLQRPGRRSALPVFSALRRNEKMRCLLALAANLKGQRAEALTAVALRYGLVAWAESRCRSRLWWRRLYA